MSRRGDSFECSGNSEHYGPDGPFDDRTGNKIVNNGPTDGKDLGGKLFGGETGAGARAETRAETAAGTGAGTGADEDALRRLLHSVVNDIEPSAGALDHLRRAVPARRARKRQALVGAAAAALLICTAVPAFVHVANSGGGDSANPVNAGHGEESQGGTGNAPGVTGGDNGVKGPTQGTGDAIPPGTSAGPNPPVGPPADGLGDGASGAVQSPAAGEVEPCTAGQLSVSTELGQPDAEGKVYGTFRITNTSATDCLASGSSVGFQTQGAADATRIGVSRHAEGDAATGLPAPAPTESDTLVVAAAKWYETKFAWVPSDTCPTEGASPAPSPSEGGTAGGGGAGGGGGSQGGTGTTDGSAVEPQLVTEGAVKDGSVTVTYAALGGSVGGQSSVPNACAGTIYYTGMLAGQ